MSQTLSVDLTGSATSFVSAVESGVSVLKKLEQQTSRMAVVGNLFKEIIAPASAAIGGAFAARAALSAFADSALPGAKRYTEAMDSAKEAVTKLAGAVGEYLAPAATRLANLITSIATPLYGYVRQFTAFSQSATQFLIVLGNNFYQAFRAVLPTVALVIDRVTAFFTQGTTDWAARIQYFRDTWNNAWRYVLAFTAPLLVAMGDLIEASISTAVEIGTIAFNELREVIGDVAHYLGSILPESESTASASMNRIAKNIRNGFIVALESAKFAILNWRDAAEIASTAVQLAFEVSVNYAIQRFGDLVDNALVVGKDIAAAFKSVGDYIVEAFEVVTPAVIELFSSMFLRLKDEAIAGAKNANAAWFHTMTGLPVKYRTLAPYVEPESVKTLGSRMPNFSIDGLESMPGFGDRKVSDNEKRLREKLGVEAGGFMGGLKFFLEGKLSEVFQKGFDFGDQVREGLPDVGATPKALDPLRVEGDTSRFRTGLLLEGSRETYQAILRAQDVAAGRSGKEDTAKAQLAEQKRTNKLIEEGQRNGRQVILGSARIP